MPSTTDLRTLGEHLRRFRHLARVTQQELIQLTDLGRMTLLRYEKGEIAKMHVAKRILNILRDARPWPVQQLVRLEEVLEWVDAAIEGRKRLPAMPPLWGANPGEPYLVREMTPRNYRAQSDAERETFRQFDPHITTELRALLHEAERLPVQDQATLVGLVKGFIMGRQR